MFAIKKKLSGSKPDGVLGIDVRSDIVYCACLIRQDKSLVLYHTQSNPWRCHGHLSLIIYKLINHLITTVKLADIVLGLSDIDVARQSIVVSCDFSIKEKCEFVEAELKKYWSLETDQFIYDCIHLPQSGQDQHKLVIYSVLKKFIYQKLSQFYFQPHNFVIEVESVVLSRLLSLGITNVLVDEACLILLVEKQSQKCFFYDFGECKFIAEQQLDFNNLAELEKFFMDLQYQAKKLLVISYLPKKLSNWQREQISIASRLDVMDFKVPSLGGASQYTMAMGLATHAI